jgi:hypothetical protein
MRLPAIVSMMGHNPRPASHSGRAFRPQEDNVADDPGDPPPDAEPGLPAGEAAGEPAAPRLHGVPNFRGHIVIDDAEPVLVFDFPAEPPFPPPVAPLGHIVVDTDNASVFSAPAEPPPPPPPPADPDGQAPQG